MPQTNARLRTDSADAMDPAVPPAAAVEKSPVKLALVSRFRAWRAGKVRASAARPVPPRRNLTATLREWHKRAGLTACIFLAWLACSGILLTRSNDFGFDVRRIDWPWLMALYGLHPEPPRNGFADVSHWLAMTKDQAVLDGKPLSLQLRAPVGLVVDQTPARTLVFVATQESLVLLGAAGERIDELRSPVLPVSNIRRIGKLKGRPGIAVQDLDAYQSADGGDSWKSVSPTDVVWSASSPLSDQQRAVLLPYSRPSVLLEQLLIDLHSGRLFGPLGSYVIMCVGCAALWLAISGLWMWRRISQSRKRSAAPARK